MPFPMQTLVPRTLSTQGPGPQEHISTVVPGVRPKAHNLPRAFGQSLSFSMRILLPAGNWFKAFWTDILSLPLYWERSRPIENDCQVSRSQYQKKRDYLATYGRTIFPRSYRNAGANGHHQGTGQEASWEFFALPGRAHLHGRRHPGSDPPSVGHLAVQTEFDTATLLPTRALTAQRTAPK